MSSNAAAGGWAPLLQSFLERTEDRELLVLGVGLAALVYAFSMRRALARFPAFPWLFAALGVLVIGLILTVVEGLVGEALGAKMNFFEHLFYFVHTTLLAIVAWRGGVGLESRHD